MVNSARGFCAAWRTANSQTCEERGWHCWALLSCTGLHDSPQNSFDGAVPTCADWPVGGRCRLRTTARHGEEQGVDLARLSHASEIEPQRLAGHRSDSDLGRDRNCRATHDRPALEPGFGNLEVVCQ